MTSEWRTEPLQNIVSYIAKGIPPAYVEIEDENIIRVLNQKCNRGFAIDYAESRLHDLRKRNVPQDKYLRDDDILINSTGKGTAGRIAQLNTVPCPTIVDGHMIILRGNEKIRPRYLGYALKSQQAAVLQLDEGSTGQTELNRNRLLAEIEISYPVSLEEQDAIAAMFYALDARIELNRRINDNLEQQAQAIFKSWFVDFEPFRDGEFVESEMGLIPKGWKIGALEDIAEITMGQSPAGNSYNESGHGCVFYQGRTEFGYRFPKVRLFTSEPKRMANAGDILLSVRAPVGDINIAPKECCVGRGVAGIRSNNQCASFLFYLMQQLKPKLEMFNGEGTVFGSINKDDLRNMKVLIPEKTVMQEFNGLIFPFDSEIKGNFDQAEILSYLRDTLLPKLMSGELSVEEAENQI